MKRRRLGWPPNSHVKKAAANARAIENAIADQEARRPKRCETKPSQVDIDGSCMHCGADNAENCRDTSRRARVPQ